MTESITFGLLTAGLMMLGLGAGLSAMLALAGKKLYVHEDPRIDAVEAMLPRANCGACGLAGCRALAEAIVAGKVSPGKCTVNSREMAEAIAKYLGVQATFEEKRVARLACAGGNNVAWQRARYQGMKTCRAAALVSGGGKECPWGCLGYGDCRDVCAFGAITMNQNDLPIVNEDKCTTCGECVRVCPKGLFSIQPVSHRLWVACKNELRGDEAEVACAVACTGCGRCAMDAPAGMIKIERNLARIDYSRNTLATLDIIQRCPTGAIVWLDKEQGAVKGRSARRVTRSLPLPMRYEVTAGRKAGSA